MDLRRLALSLWLGIAVPALPGAVIHRYPLDERTAYTVRIAPDEPTTCLFPAPITALEGGNVSSQASDAPPVLLSFQPGATFFSVRALRDEARAAINVILRGKVYVLTFEAGAAADRAVSFEDPTPVMPAHAVTPAGGTAVVAALIERAQRHELIAEQYPALTQVIDRHRPDAVTRYPGFTVTVNEVFRFGAEDVLVVRATLANSGDAPLRYDPSGIALRVGPVIYPAARVEGAGVVPANADATV